MKLTALVFAASCAALATAEADPNRCWRRGMPCSKLKRSVDVASTILDEPVDTSSPLAKRCFEPGQPCAKAKRAENSLRAALKDADVNNYDGSSSPKAHFCEKGKPCPKAVKHVARSVPSDLEARDDSTGDHDYCHSEGGQCHKVKRAAEALANALAAPEAEAEADPEPNRCWRRGMPCSKAKRNRCWRRGMPCSKAKRAIDDLSEAAIDATDYVTEDLAGSDYTEQ